LRETREAWPALGFYERFEQVVCLVLTEPHPVLTGQGA
jgi:hypothetical protein